MKRWLTCLFAAIPALVLAAIPVTSGPRLYVDEGGGGASNVTASIVASRTSCTAPCAVHFDAVGTTHTDGGIDTFRELGYSINYGDPGSGNHSISGESQNVDRGGPLFGHLYRTAGTYTVEMTACYDEDEDGTCESGEYDLAETTITVAAADTVYSGTNTVCLSTNTNHTDCPSGATQTSNVSAWPTFANNRRYLLHTGQDFTSLGKMNLEQSNSDGLQGVQIGSYGSGARPITADIEVDSNTQDDGPGSTTWPSNVTLYGLNPQNTSVRVGGFNIAFINFLGQTGTNIGSFFFGDAFNFYSTDRTQDAWENPGPVYIFDSEFNESGIGADTSTHMVVMNSRGTNTTQHNMRTATAFKMVVAHNEFTGLITDDSSRHTLKLHSRGSDAIDEGQWSDLPPSSLFQRTKYVVARNNIFGGDGVGEGNAQWTVSFGPQGFPSDEGVEDMIVENSTFYHSATTMTDFTHGGRRITQRGNARAGGGSINHGAGHAPPSGWDGPYYDSDDPIPTIDP